MAFRGSSLRSLQSLETEECGFEEQLEKLRKITQLDNALNAQGTKMTWTGARRYHGREEWAIRWILRKLQSGGKDASEARSSAYAWTTLAHLIEVAPVHVAAKTLAANKFLDSLEKTLQESFGDYNRIAIYGDISAKDIYLAEPSADASDKSEPNLQTVPSTSKKRKRGRCVETEPRLEREELSKKSFETVIKPDSRAQSLLNLFQSLALFLENLSKVTSRLETNGFGSPSGNQHSLLSTDPEQSTIILGTWLSAISNVEAKRCLTREICDCIDSSLATVFRVWENRSANLPSQIEGISVPFSQHCLVPAAKLLSIDEPTTTGLNGIRISVRNVIEQLLAKHLFMTAKSDFLHRLQSQDAGAEHSLNGKTDRLSHLLQPLRSSLETNLSEKDKGQLNFAFSLLSSVPVLFNIAVRCTPLSTPRRRLAEYPWLEHVFIELMSCLGLDKIKETNTTYRQGELFQLTRLLEIAQETKLKFSHTILERIARDWCGLTSSTIAEPNWTAISHLIGLDANIFLKGTKTSRSKTDGTESNLAILLFTSISDRVWVSDGPRTDQLNFNSAEYETVKIRVLIPLLRAYSSARDTPGFMKHWHEGLIRFSQDNDHGLDLSIWEDPSLNVVLMEILESTMTSNQIYEFAKNQLVDLQTLQGGKISIKEFHRASASAVILKAIFDAIQSDETATILLPVAFKALEDAFALLSLEHTIYFAHRQRLWLLIGSSHRLWSSFVELEVVPTTAQPNSAIFEPLSRAYQTIKPGGKSSSETESASNINEIIEALACLGSILNDRQMRNWSSDQLWPISVSLLELLIPNFGLKSSYSDDTNPRLWEILAQYPILLRLDEKSENDFKEEVLHQMISSDSHLINKSITEHGSLTTKSMWLQIVSRSLWESTWLLEDIQRELRKLDSMQNDKKFSIDELGKLHRLKELSYMQIPSSYFPSRERKKILNNSIEIIKALGPTFEASDWSRTLSLILHMMNVLPDAVGLSIPFTDLLAIAKTIDTSLAASNSLTEAALGFLAIFKKVAEQSLLHEVHISGQNQAETFLKDIINQSIQLESPNFFEACRLELISATLDVLSALRVNQEGSSSGPVDVHGELCQTLCESASQRWTKFESTNEDRRDLVQILERHVSVLAQIDETVLRKHQFVVHSVSTIIERVLQEIQDESKPAVEVISSLAVLNYKLGWKTDSQHPEALELSPAYTMLQEGLRNGSQATLQKFLLDVFQRLSKEQRGDKLRDLLDDCQNASPAECTSRWHLLHMLVSTSNNLKSPASKTLIPPSEIPTLLIALSTNLPKSPTLQTFHFLTSTIMGLLRNSTPTNHLAIEAVLLGISGVLATTSVIKSSLSPTHGPRVFTNLTTIVRVLLTQHRQRLRGRFDLLVATLQALLAQLFVLPRTPRRLRWALTATHAEAFTRLVTTLCDPSVSSTTTSRHPKMHLTDERRKARTYAGQYVPALLLTLCHLQLQRRFAGEGVREALAPGVYVMLDVMGKDVLAATNEGIEMPSGVRTLLRQWVDEWRRERR